MPYKPILATLGYVMSPNGQKVLLIHRNGRANDYHLGKFNGLGGKVDEGEDIVACLRREIREEAGLECHSMKLCGTVSWPKFGPHGEDWFGFIFRIDDWHGTPPDNNPEGTLSWVDVEHILDLPLWEGDRHFLPLVFGCNGRQFHGVMPYDQGRPQGWSCSLI